MRYALNSSNMKEIDQYSINTVGIPSLILMERAALQVASCVKSHGSKQDPILVVCGMGNNGGDGLAIARILFLEGYDVTIYLLGEEEKATSETKQQLKIIKNLNIKRENNNKLNEYNIIIDAIFGIGITRPVVGLYQEIIEEINRNNNLVISVDVPSGISADTGKVLNCGVKADYTITFGYGKMGLFLYPGADYAGKVSVVDIGFSPAGLNQDMIHTFYYEKEDLSKLPQRKEYSNKGTYGKVLVIAGGPGMSGAAFLSALAAYRTGAGLVKVLTSYQNRISIQTGLPEAIFVAYDEDEVRSSDELRIEDIKKAMEWATCIIVGPGLGTNHKVRELFELVIKEARVPLIIDADGVRILGMEMEERGIVGWNRRDYLNNRLSEYTILTPHIKEFADLFDQPVSQIKENIIDSANQCSYNSKLIYAIKDARSIVAFEQKRYINLSGNHGMATGGSGDVLTGIIAGLIAQGTNPYEATCLGVYLHGLAGAYAANVKSKYSMIARDIIDGVGQCFMDIEKNPIESKATFAK